MVVDLIIDGRSGEVFLLEAMLVSIGLGAAGCHEAWRGRFPSIVILRLARLGEGCK